MTTIAPIGPEISPDLNLRDNTARSRAEAIPN
jgi:hypothetical protein